MEYLNPIRESQVRCDDSTHRLISRGEQLKEQFSTSEIKCHIPKLIYYEKVDLFKLPDINRELVIVSCLDHLIDQRRSRAESFPIVLLAGSNSYCNCQMSLASS